MLYHKRIFSARSSYERQPNAVEVLRGRLLKQGVAITDLSETNPTKVGLILPSLADISMGSAFAGQYTADPLGLPTARRALAQVLSDSGNIGPERILLTASTSEAYAYLFKLLCDPGDEVLVPQPSYPLLEQLAQAEGVRLVRYPLRWAGQWQLDAYELAARITSKSRTIVIINPNNPTGSYVKESELAALLDFKLPLICDEVFLPYVLSADREIGHSLLAHASAISGPTPHFVLGGLSKFIGLPQLKCSWCVVCGTGSLVDEALWRLECLADTFLSVNTPVQEALPHLLDRSRPIQDAIAQRLEDNLSHMLEVCRHHNSALSVRTPEGGWSAVIQLPDIRTDEQWTLSLLEEAHLGVQPGYFFDFLEPSCIVISLLSEPAAFKHGVAALSSHVQNICHQKR